MLTVSGDGLYFAPCTSLWNYHRAMLNERLKKLRLGKGLTLQQVGDHFGISKSSVANWENGINQPDSRKLEALAELFKTSVEYLITGKSSHIAINQDSHINQVRFIRWEDVVNLKFDHHQYTLPTLYSRPTIEAFSTRAICSSDIDWTPGPIPTGSIIFVEPNKVPSQGNLVLAFDSSENLGIAECIFFNNSQEFQLRFCNKNDAIDSSKNPRILGVLIEWRLDGKL